GLLKAASDFISLSERDVTSPTIVIEIQEVGTKRNIVDKKEISSEFKSGTRSVPNPNYSIAEMNCRRAQSDVAAQRARNTIAPAAGWGAVVQGIAAGVAGADAEIACNQ